MLPDFVAHVPADARDNDRHHYTDTQKGSQCQKTEPDVEGPDINAHHGLHDKCDADGRNSVRVEHFQKLYVRSDQRDQVTFVPDFELGGAEPSQRAEYSVADEREQRKCDIVVQSLLNETKDRPDQRQNREQNPDGADFDGYVQPQTAQNRVSAQYRDKLHGEISERSRRHCQDHIAGERSDQTEHLKERYEL